jgi:hypothetical protein
MAYGERQNSVRDGICSGFESFVAVCILNLESGNLVDVVGAFHTMAEWLAINVRYSAVFLELKNAFSALYMCTREGGYKPETSKLRGYNADDVSTRTFLGALSNRPAFQKQRQQSQHCSLCPVAAKTLRPCIDDTMPRFPLL